MKSHDEIYHLFYEKGRSADTPYTWEDFFMTARTMQLPDGEEHPDQVAAQAHSGNYCGCAVGEAREKIGVQMRAFNMVQHGDVLESLSIDFMDCIANCEWVVASWLRNKIRLRVRASQFSGKFELDQGE